jgi:hypothetical protein
MATPALSFDVDGSEAVSSVLLELLNTFPGLGTRKIAFSTLSESSGIGFFPTSGAAILSDKEDITGHVKQVCLYPFNVIYRSAPRTEGQKLKAKEFLDTLGKWLERQPVVINGTEHQISAYPPLPSGNREIKSISRSNPAHLSAAYQDAIEDWAISITLRYENEFDK